MMGESMKFVIRLQDAHNKKRVTPYRVWKETGVQKNTVKRYAENKEVVLDFLPSTAIILANYYGVDWRDPAIVDVIGEAARR